MISKLYSTLSDSELIEFDKFLKNAAEDTAYPAYKNMYDKEWETKPNTLPYILKKTKRFEKNGIFQILYADEKIIACSGCYSSNFSSDVAILGCRTYIVPEYRNKLISREYLLPLEKQWATDQGHKILVLTFNDYNKNLIYTWTKIRLGEKRKERESKHFGYYGIDTLNFPVNIQHTKQWIVYEKLNNNFDFNWDIIRWED